MFVSIVMPVYNEAAFIKNCLDAIAKQTRLPDVVYIVDNNSTDDSIKIAEAYPFVKVIQEHTQGICAVAKKGLDVAAGNGGIILRLDADCQPTKDWVEKISANFISDNSVVATTGPGVTYDANPVVKVLFSALYMKPYFWLVSSALGRKPLFGLNFAIKADTWKRVSNHTHLSLYQNIHDDMDISYHILNEGDIKYDPTLKMPLSARPFRASFPKVVARYAAGFRSIFIHWPQQAPWVNWTK